MREYYSISSSVIEKIKVMKTEGKSAEEIERKVLKENKLNPEMVAYITTKGATA